jgi:hypothetical protein
VAGVAGGGTRSASRERESPARHRAATHPKAEGRGAERINNCLRTGPHLGGAESEPNPPPGPGTGERRCLPPPVAADVGPDPRRPRGGSPGAYSLSADSTGPCPSCGVRGERVGIGTCPVSGVPAFGPRPVRWKAWVGRNAVAFSVSAERGRLGPEGEDKGQGHRLHRPEGPTSRPRRDAEYIPGSDMAPRDAAGVGGGDRILIHGAPLPGVMPNGCLGGLAPVLPRP